MAAVRATLQQHGAAAGIAEPKATPVDAAPVKPVPDTAAANEARNAMDVGGAAEAMDEDGAAATSDEDNCCPRPKTRRRPVGPELAG